MKQNVRDQPLEYRRDDPSGWELIIGWATVLLVIGGAAWLSWAVWR